LWDNTSQTNAATTQAADLALTGALSPTTVGLTLYLGSAIRLEPGLENNLGWLLAPGRPSLQ
jgi:hypothetical protein